MGESIFIFGMTDLAVNLYYHLKCSNVHIDGFVVNESYKNIDVFEGLPVYGYENLSILFPHKNLSFYICVGYKKMNSCRKEIYNMIKRDGYTIKSYIHKTAEVYASDIGEGNLIFEQAYIGMYSKIGDGNIFYPKSMIAHHVSVKDYNFFSISSSVAGWVLVGDENFFGNNSTTKDKITIGNRVLVGAGAYIDSDLKDDKVIVPQKSVILSDKKSIDFL